jgi:hypothetical protein
LRESKHPHVSIEATGKEVVRKGLTRHNWIKIHKEKSHAKFLVSFNSSTQKVSTSQD